MQTRTVLFLDFETYYDQEYSLKKMAPPNYILDPRYETIGCSFMAGDDAAEFVDGPDIEAYLRRFDPAHTTTVAFNALFDNCILAWRYGFVPDRMVCTMRLACALRGHLLQRYSLASVAKYLGLGVKGTTISNVCGMRRSDIMSNLSLWRDYQSYSNNDNDLSRGIYRTLMPEFPASERRIMDRVLRCSIEPKFVVDQDMLEKHLLDLKAEKTRMLIDAGADTFVGDPDMEDKLVAFSRTIRSNVQFEEKLKLLGVDIECKASTTDPTRQIPAFAKTDQFMADLQEHDDPDVQALAAIRLGLRSTIEESRGQRIASIGKLPWRYSALGSLPIPLRYAGAHTHRLSGDWKLNMQNLPSSRKVGSKLRKSLKAPEGYEVVVADKSQIECRINGWLCGQQDLLEIFRTGGDPYSVLATSIFGFIVDKNIHKVERFIGKSGVLGLGFGCGPDKFYSMVVRSARVLGMDVKELLKFWTPLLAGKAVQVYRTLNMGIVATWRTLDTILKTAWLGVSLPVKFGPCIIGHGYVEGPGGLRMNYARPRIDENGDLRYDYGARSFKMYGSKFLENIVQFLARINTMHDGLRISDRGFTFCSSSHDEFVWVVPKEKVALCKKIAMEEMTRSPSWAKDLPLNAEVSSGPTYGDAK